MNELELIARFAASLSIGLLLGLERERIRSAKAGLRTFGLVALFGTLCGLLSDKTGNAWIFPAGLLALGGMMVSSYRRAGPEDDPGTTSVVALLICFGLGAAIWYGYQHIAVVIALTVTSLLYFKAELHGMTQRLSRQDWISLLQLAVVSLVVLPVLPNTGMGPYGALNPYRIWLMVVLISGLSFTGYVVLRLAGEARGLPLIGLLGGLVSSTATTLAYSRHTRAARISGGAGLVVILIANAAVLIKLAVITTLISPALVPKLVPMFAAGLLAGLPLPLLTWRGLASEAEAPHLEVSNPSEMRIALGFGALFAIVLLAVTWIHEVAGSAGVYSMAVLSGLTDIDAITLSTLQLANAGSLSGDQAAKAIALAYAASIVMKFGIAWGIAGRPVARRAALGYLCVLGGMAAGLAVTG
ncbi:MAG: MgtC/SapB family protein [Nevskia sp.]|nr:MgtC/SapB family protein [Nevskia sp.]